MKRSAVGLWFMLVSRVAFAHGAGESEGEHPVDVRLALAVARPSKIAPGGEAVGTWRLDGPTRALGGGFSLVVGGFSLREYDALATTALGFDAASLSYDASQSIGGARLFIHGRANVSLFHATHSRMPYLAESMQSPTLCLTQSELVLAAGLALPLASIALFGSAQDDPLHFGLGRACLGDPWLWVHGRRAGLALAIEPSERVRVDVVLEASEHHLAWELDSFGQLEVRALAARIELTIAI